MKPTIALATLALAALALAGCAAGPGDAPTGETDGGTSTAIDARGEWLFTGGTEGDRELKVSRFPLTILFSDGVARVSSGCWAQDMPMTGDLDIVTASFSTGTPSASCMPFTPDETAAFAELEDVTDVARDGDELTLSAGDYDLEFELVPAASADSLVGTWSLDSIMFGDTGMGATPGAHITFGSDGTITGSTGCNDITGTFDSVVSGRNVVTDLSVGDKTCLDEVTEEQIVSTLEEGFLVHVNDGSLQLVSTTDVASLSFTPAA